MSKTPDPITNIDNAKVLVMLADSVTTDHISPAGSIGVKSSAGQYLLSQGVEPKDFNSYGSRRGNHEVMMRATFANIRLKNLLLPGTVGDVTLYQPNGEQMPIFDAAMRYEKDGTPLIVLAGKEYGAGSSRDWAAKGPKLLGVTAVIAESFERIHRSNLIGMGILPLLYTDGENAQTLGLTGTETFSIELSNLAPMQPITVTITNADKSTRTFTTMSSIYTPKEFQYYKNGGILQYVLRHLAA
jgi:aconitate hydratase